MLFFTHTITLNCRRMLKHMVHTFGWVLISMTLTHGLRAASTGVDWATYLGGSALDGIAGIAVDAQSNVIVAGYTMSSNWIAGGVNTNYYGDLDAFVAKLSPEGIPLWSTYLGGTNREWALCVAVDVNGFIYTGGMTSSRGWTRNTSGTNYHGSYDAFVAKLSPNGAHLWSTYLGGTNSEGAFGIAVDRTNFVYVTGYTRSSGWVKGGFDPTFNGAQVSLGDGFVVKLTSSGLHTWSTYLGGIGDEGAFGIAVDTATNVVVVGSTTSAGWIGGGYNTHYSGGGTNANGFVLKLNALGKYLWGTYLGGAHGESALAVAADAQHSIWVTGWTQSPGWTSGGANTNYNGGDLSDSRNEDAFVVKLSPNGGHLWSSYVGGPRREEGKSIAIDAQGNAILTGQTEPGDWVFGGVKPEHATGIWDAFVLKLSTTGVPLWSTYLGGTNDDFGLSVAVDRHNHILVAGESLSPSWINEGLNPSFGGERDGFVVKLFDYSGTNAIPYLFSISRTNITDLVLDLSAAGYSPSKVLLESGESLGPDATWNTISNAVWSSHGPGRYHVQVPQNEAGQFYRVNAKP
jgi:hypothetical protein